MTIARGPIVVYDRTLRLTSIDPRAGGVHKRRRYVCGNVRFSDCDCNVNENGHYLAEKHTFIYTDSKHGPTVPLIGTAVLFGELTRGGREASLKLPLDAVRERVRFPSPTAN